MMAKQTQSKQKISILDLLQGGPLRVAIYVRVSREEQVKYGHSLDNQLNMCIAFAQQNNYEVVKIFQEEGRSAKDTKRPRLQELLTEKKKGKLKIDAVLVWRIDRFTRKNKDYHGELAAFFEDYKLQLLSATEPNNVKDPNVKLNRNINLAVAEWESDINSLRTSSTMLGRVKQGYYPSKPPVGYVNIERNNKKIIEQDPETAPYVKRVFEMYSTGLYTYKSIAQELSASGFIVNKQPVNHKCVENILHKFAPFYIGKIIWKSEEYQGKQEPIIDAALLAAANAAMSDRGFEKTQVHHFLYRGIIKDGRTGKPLTAQTQKGQHKSGEYKYYNSLRCEGMKKLYIREEIIDKKVLEMLDSFKIKPEELTEMRNTIKEILSFNEKYDEHERTNIQTQITAYGSRIDKLYIDKLDGKVTEEFFDKQYEKFNNIIEDLNIKFLALTQTNKEIIKKMNMLFELCKDLKGVYLRLNFENKRQLLKLLCSNLFYDGENVVITIKNAFDVIIKNALLINGADDGT